MDEGRKETLHEVLELVKQGYTAEQIEAKLSTGTEPAFPRRNQKALAVQAGGRDHAGGGQWFSLPSCPLRF
ncbi:hypothetical protein AGMMS50268_27910 [Spirochaetia bacterium]|nr:hypothetical protein AGMMS50268_27910 [Spirochaetia bacterium]